MSRPTPPLLFGAIADDLTGGTELASMLVARGIPTGCTVGTDAPIQAGNVAHVILLKTRVIPAADAVAQVLRAAEKLLAAGARQIFFKYCATFDSTPAGNIGPCAEALLERLGAAVTLFTPALCETGRTVYQGHMFGGTQLLGESPKRFDPLTPMTDANLVLGRLAPKKLLAVENPATVERVAAVFEEKIGRAAGLSAVDAAGAVLRLGNMKMAGAIRMVSIGRGHDPRDFALFAFGGAGPLHASALARELGLPKVLVPARPGITNALGCVVADMRHDFVNTVNQPVAGIDEARMLAILQDHEAQGRALIAQEAVEPSEIRVTHSADMQFVGQTHIVNVPLPAAGISRATLQTLFEKAYFARFKVELPEIRANLVNLNTSVTGVRHQVDLSRLIDPDGRAATLEGALLETRPVWFSGTWHDTPVYAREKLPLAAAVAGPAILEQMDATTVLEPGDMARGDADGNIVIEVGT